MRETEYIRTVHKLLPPSIYRLKLNLPYTAGVADCYYSGSRSDLWVEWKYFKTFPMRVDLRCGKHPILTRLQQDWLEHRHREGRLVAVIIGSAKGCVIYPGLEWMQVLARKHFMAQMVDREATAQWIKQQCEAPYAASEIAPVAESIALDGGAHACLP